MRADEGLVALAQAKGVFEMTTAGKQLGGQLGRERNRLWRVATRTAEKLLAACCHARDGIIAAHVDGAIMREHGSGDSCQALPRIFVVIGDWFIAQVAAGHDKHCRSSRFNVSSKIAQ